MPHAFDRKINVGDPYEKRWLRVTVDHADEEGESIDFSHRYIALEDEDTGETWALGEKQAHELAQALCDGLAAAGLRKLLLVEK